LPGAGHEQRYLYKWRAKFGGMDTSMMSRIKKLEVENRRLKKMYLQKQIKAEIAAAKRLRCTV